MPGVRRQVDADDNPALDCDSWTSKKSRMPLLNYRRHRWRNWRRGLNSSTLNSGTMRSKRMHGMAGSIRYLMKPRVILTRVAANRCDASGFTTILASLSPPHDHRLPESV